MNPKQIENKFYAARNSEFDTDEVKNIVHKETNDAEYGIDKERLSNKSFKFNAYFAWKGERVQSARFNTREDAQRWIDKQVAKRHPNKRFSRPGVKDTMAVEDRFYFGKGRKERFANSPFEQIAGQERLSDAITKMGSANAMLDVLAYFARQYGKERIVKAVRNTYSSARAKEILSKLFATI